MLAVAIAFVVVPVPAMAAHNSVGGQVDIVTPDEVDAGADAANPGQISADIGVYQDELSHYEHLKDRGLKERSIPQDQSGDRYRESSCDTHGEINSGATPDDPRLGPDESEPGTFNPATDPTDCYIGMFDAQHEYMLATNLFLTKQPSDLAYPANPDPDETEGQCTGEKNTDDRGLGTITVPVVGEEIDGSIPGLVPGDDPVDQAITRVLRATSASCAGDGHPQFIPGSINVETQLIENPQGQGVSTVASAAQTQPGSGTITLPLLSTPYVFLFGESHPNAEPERDPFPNDDSRDRYEAGVGLFGGQPTAGGTPLWDLTGACGDRTDECALLTPADIKEYDKQTDRKPDTQDDQARVCVHSHQIAILNPDQRDAGLCGVFGLVVNQFLGAGQLGGLGTGAPTWLNTIPGWHQGLIYLGEGEVEHVQEFADEYVRDPAEGNYDEIQAADGLPVFDRAPDGSASDGVIDPGLIVHYSVNPKVPAADDDLWCARPNIMATGEDDFVKNALPGLYGGSDPVATDDPDPGLYGTYIADAIDSDVYVNPSQGAYEQAFAATHSDARSVISQVEPLADDVTDQTDVGEDPIPVDELDFTESDEDDPASEPGLQNQRSFTLTKGPGLECTVDGDVTVFDQAETLAGGLNFDTEVVHTQGGVTVAPLGIGVVGVDGQNPKDPTAGGGAAPEEDTKEGHWNPELYTFGGSIQGIIDSNDNGTFDDCALATGQPQPERDFCPFRALWDAYNPECTAFAGTRCGNTSRQMGYNTSAGVGLFLKLEMSGPIVVVDEVEDKGLFQLARTNETTARTTVLGTEDQTGQQCVAALSNGFADKLAGFIGTDTGVDPLLGSVDDTFDADDVEALCPDQHDDADEDSLTSDDYLVMLDGFDDQSGTNRGGFSAAFNVLKLAPTPEAVQEDAETGLGDGDQVCVTGIWSVQGTEDDGSAVITDDSNNTLDLGAEQATETVSDVSQGLRTDIYPASDDRDAYEFGDCDSLETGVKGEDTGPGDEA